MRERKMVPFYETPCIFISLTDSRPLTLEMVHSGRFVCCRLHNRLCVYDGFQSAVW